MKSVLLSLKSSYFVLLISVVFAACNPVTEKQSAQRPNILFIMSDDHAFQAISMKM
ncbi:MAG: hypothetical protein ACK5HT_12075 [Draconibacterium sp.]